MKYFRLALAATLLSSVTLAHASYKGEVSAAPFNWTGFYGGLNIGAVKHSMDITDVNATTFNSTIHHVSNPQFTGGFQFGYLRQLALTSVSGIFGAEFSANFSNAMTNQEYGSAASIFQLDINSKLQTLCLLQVIGGIAADRTLLFLSGGLSWANISGNAINVATIPFFNSFSLNKNPLGSVIGGGIEYAFTDKISARVKVDVVTPNVYTSHDNLGDAFQISNHIVQATLGVNYKIG